MFRHAAQWVLSQHSSECMCALCAGAILAAYSAVEAHYLKQIVLMVMTH